MALPQWMIERLQQKQKPRVKLRTGQDVAKEGDDYDPAAPVNQRNPRTARYLSSDYDASPLDKAYGQRDLTQQLQSVSQMGGIANEATGAAVQYRQQAQALKEAAEKQAAQERASEVQGFINNMQMADPNVDITTRINPGGFQVNPGQVGFSGQFGSNGGGGQAAAPGQSGISARRQKVLNAAKRQLGVPYQWGGGGGKSRGRSGKSYGFIGAAGGSNLRGFDCSGLTDYAYSQLGWNIGYTTREQSPWAVRRGKVVPKSKLVPGDIVFGGGGPGNYGGVHHVGIYWGNGKIIEAPQTWVNGKRGKVRIAPMRSGQWGVHLNY